MLQLEASQLPVMAWQLESTRALHRAWERASCHIGTHDALMLVSIRFAVSLFQASG